MEGNPILSQLRLCTYNIFGWHTADYKDSEELVAALFARLDADIYSMNEVIAPNQEWFHFLLTLDKKLAVMDGGTKSDAGVFSSTKESTTSDETTSRTGGKPNSEQTDSAPSSHKDSLTENEVISMIDRLKYYVMNIMDSGLSNSLVVNRRRGKALERSSVFEFGHQLLMVRGIETRGACHVRVIHPVVGAMEIYSLHLDHMWEQNRHAQLEQLHERVYSTKKPLPHVIMGDFNAITKSDYSPEYEEENIRLVRERGRWERPTYTLTEYFAGLGYVDFWRKCNPGVFDREVTTCAYDTRIDYIWISKELVPLIDWEHTNTYSQILNEVHLSDHFPVLANIQFKPKAR